jgi:short-subunit dehydrogenase
MKTILITGATAGIGRHAALELVRLGHHVLATGRREKALADLAAEARAAAKVTGKGGKLDAMRLDVTSEADVKKVAAEVETLTKGRGLDVLVNNAGYGQMGPLETVSDAELRKQYETNVFGLMNVTRAFLPKMRERGEGRIINVGSVGGRMTFPLMAAYNSTKYAVESISDGLRNELAPFGIEVSLVEPGPIRTEFNDVAMETIDHRAVEESPYAPIVAAADEFRRRFEKYSAGPEVTTRAIVHASIARRPRVRYVVPFSSAMMLAVVSWLPTRIVDSLMRTLAGLTRKNLAKGAPRSLPAAKNERKEEAAAA